MINQLDIYQHLVLFVTFLHQELAFVNRPAQSANTLILSSSTTQLGIEPVL